MKLQYNKLLLLLIVSITFPNVHTSYLWHLQQPNYWPERSEWNPNRYQTVWESYWLKINNGNWYSDGQQHPSNDLEEIFNKDDRIAVYQYRTKEAVQSLLSLPEAGAQVNYSGCLIENINSLANAGEWGYSQGWENNFQEARSWTTSGGKPRMDIMGFTMHHALSPLIDENCLRKQIQAHRYIYGQTFGANPYYSKGFWPAECAFSERIIKVLVEEGFEWSVIANSHLARTLQDYPLEYGTSGCNIDPPNQADVVGPNGNNWWNGQIDGRGGVFAAPFCYQAHKAKYVDPETGQEYKITVVPMGDLLSYMNGYGTMGTGEIDSYIAPYDNPSQPSIVLMAHDGDNAWGGGFSYYSESVPGFAEAAAGQGYSPTTIEQFLADHPVPEDDIVHVEDGAWVNAANDWGHPQFINWLWPMYNGSYQFDPQGWTEDARNWAVLTAAENHVEMAEDLTGNLNIAHIVNPSASSNNAELAWHHFLPAFTSGYMYYGTSLDMEVKPTLAGNLAVEYADQVIGSHPGEDNTSPTIFIPQRFPYNPGGTGFGPIYGYQQYQNSSDFHIWTFVYDVSGLQSVTLKYRIDNDGVNPVTENDNETYAGGTGVGAWASIPMTERIFPTGNVTGNPNIDFFIMPVYIANEYYAEVTDISNSLVDYYVEAVDDYGNIKRSPIQHVYVGESNPGTGPGNWVWWSPEEPNAGETVTIYYGDAGFLFDSDPLYIHLGTNGWQGVQDYPMIFNADSNAWAFSYETNQSTTAIDFVFTDLLGNWDNNNWSDWHITVAGGGSQAFVMDGELDPSAQLLLSNDDLSLYATFNGSELYVAAPSAQSLQNDVFIFISENPSQLVSAPWAKSGQVANWDVYLANESTNNWSGWFDFTAGVVSTAGNMLEGAILIADEWGGVPDQLYLALGIYGTNDGDPLIAQLPIGNGNGNIEMDEFFPYQFNQFSVIIDHIYGWDLVGLPLEVDDALYGTLFPSSETGTLYGFDGSYFITDELLAGNGYWLFFNEAGSDLLSGTAINILTISLMEGWNLISGLSTSIPVAAIEDPDGIIVPGTTYGFDGSYFSTSSFEPGNGYWIYASAGGSITLTNGTVANTKTTFTDRTLGANAISFNGQTLYFGIEVPTKEINSYRLPPRPPQGAFACPDKERSECIGDVRFTGDLKIIENFGEIEVMNNTDKLTISYVINSDSEKWLLVNSTTGEKYELSETGEITVIGYVKQFVLEKIPEIPASFALMQNYPNPFNPITKITYDVAGAANVKIEIFNMVGQKVKTLVEGSHEAGRYQVQWDSTNDMGFPLASGMYFYTMNANDFIEVKKMILMK